MTVYFISKTGDETKVKVGATRNFSHRMQNLGAALGPIDLIGTLPGDEATERMLHKLFDAHRVEGEWFHRVAAVSDFITEHFPVEGVKHFTPRDKGWKSGHECGAVDSDRAIAGRLLAKIADGYPRTMTTISVLEDIYLRLSELNGVWTRRRVRALHENAGRRIDLFEIKDMLTLLEIPHAEWGAILSGLSAP